MRIAATQIYSYNGASYIPKLAKTETSQSHVTNTVSQKEFAKIPLGYRFNANINFTAQQPTVPLIEIEAYKAMSEEEKNQYRQLYRDFSKRPDLNELFDLKPEHKCLPLQTEHEMEKFLDVVKWYNNFREHPIVCLGRSPKWFLNANLWMQGGIQDHYTFTAFSKYWYRPDYREGMKLLPAAKPTAEEYAAYKEYLKETQADPRGRAAARPFPRNACR